MDNTESGQRPGVAMALAHGVPADEIDRWSPERRSNIVGTGHRSPIQTHKHQNEEKSGSDARRMQPRFLIRWTTHQTANPADSISLASRSVLDAAPSAFLWW